MMRGWRLLLLPLLAAASAPVVAPRETIDAALARARAEASVADQRVKQLDAAARKATDETARLRAEQAAAAAGIEAAEARISVADADLRRARAEVALRESRLAAKRAPAAALLAGIVTMGRRPPLLALADGSSVSELVRVRALLDATGPLIERRSAALSAELAAGRRLAGEAGRARLALARSRDELAQRKTKFARLEARAAGRAQKLTGAALGEDDRVLASGESISELAGAAAAEAAARTQARALAELPLSAPRPSRVAHPKPPIAYMLPSAAPVVEGLGAVSPVGIASRGIRLATPRGAALTVPADGRIAFAGAYREEDGVVIIDHGGGWTTLMLNVATPLARGAKVHRGEPLGRALGDVTVELSEGAARRSAALIAGSSRLLSKGRETR